MSAIELVGVSRHYGSVRAVDEVSLTVGQGEFVTILGPSGSGKTTLLNLIAGLSEPTGGRIVIGGRDVTRLPPAERNVGLVFQSYALFPNMTVAGNVAFPLEVRRVPRLEIARRVEAALRLVRLHGLEDRRPGQLSGGQQQRVALARAIVFEPSILLLDEPLAALDRKLREEVRVELRRLQRTLGVTTLLVTHDQDEALSLSDWIVVLAGGRVRQKGPPDEAYRRPASRFVADFLGAANLFEGELRRGGEGAELLLGTGERIAVGAVTAAGGRACALVRPERVVLAAEGEGLTATVIEAVYHGQIIRYHLRLADGREVVAAAADVTPRFRPEARVRVRWHPDDVWIIPGDGPDETGGADPEAAGGPAGVGEGHSTACPERGRAETWA